MMTVLSIKNIDVKRDPAVIAKSSEEFLDEFEVEGPNLPPSQFHMKD